MVKERKSILIVLTNYILLDNQETEKIESWVGLDLMVERISLVFIFGFQIP